MAKAELMVVESVERTIRVLRGHKVLLDADLAELYGVTAKRLNEQVKRNAARFPEDFMFQLTPAEHANLRSQIATSSSGTHGGRRHAPFAFTEHGTIMAASVLNSPKALEMSVLVVRAFVRLRQIVASHQQLTAKLNELERKYASHDTQIAALINAVRALMTSPVKPRKRIGFRVE